MILPPSASLFELDVFEPLPIRIGVPDAPPTSDAGLLPLRQLDERLGLTKQLAAVLDLRTLRRPWIASRVPVGAPPAHEVMTFDFISRGIARTVLIRMKGPDWPSAIAAKK